MEYLKYLTVLVSGVLILGTACKKEEKIYNGPAQVAFENNTYAFKITSDTTITIPIQLISSQPQPTFSVQVVADSSALGNVVSKAAFPATLEIANGRFVTLLSIDFNAADLPAGEKRILRLNLSSNAVKVAENYKAAIITITR